jgi:hypothetical protein
MNRDVGVDKVGHDPAEPLIPPPQRNLDRLPFFDVTWFGHAPKSGNDIAHGVARREDRDDVAKTRYFEIDVRVLVGELGRNAYGLAISRFERTGPGHLQLFLAAFDIYQQRLPASILVYTLA